MNNISSLYVYIWGGIKIKILIKKLFYKEENDKEYYGILIFNKICKNLVLPDLTIHKL